MSNDIILLDTVKGTGKKMATMSYAPRTSQRRSRGGQWYRMRRGRSRGRRNSSGMGNLMPYVGGMTVGYLAPRFHPLQDLIITALAVAPIKLPRIAGFSVKYVAQGYVMGSLVRVFVPSILGQPAATGGVTKI